MSNDAGELFEAIKADGYKFGNCSVKVYDRNDLQTYADDFLLQLYRATRPVLAQTFCGMTDLSAPAICAYLSTRSPLLLMCVDNPTTKSFDVIGYSFPTIWAGNKDSGRSMLMGYAAMKPWYGTAELTVSMMLTGIYYFTEFDLLSIHGQSYRHNQLTRKFLLQFGTKTTGFIPDFLIHDGKMVECVISSLSRSDFMAYVQKTIAECSNT